MSVSIALSSAAMAQSSASNSQAAYAATQIKMLRCEATMKSPDLSTVLGRRGYSECVSYMEPEASRPPSNEAKLQVSALVALLVVFIIAGAFIGQRDPYTGWGFGMFIGAVAYLFAGIVVVLISLFVAFLMA